MQAAWVAINWWVPMGWMKFPGRPDLARELYFARSCSRATNNTSHQYLSGGTVVLFWRLLSYVVESKFLQKKVSSLYSDVGTLKKET